jgi:hypothetical protein
MLGSPLTCLATVNTFVKVIASLNNDLSESVALQVKSARPSLISDTIILLSVAS